MKEETKFYSVTISKQIKENSYVFIIETSNRYIPDYTTTSQNIYIQRFKQNDITDCYMFIHKYAKCVNISDIHIINMDTFNEQYTGEKSPEYNLN